MDLSQTILMIIPVHNVFVVIFSNNEKASIASIKLLTIEQQIVAQSNLTKCQGHLLIWYKILINK